MKTVEELKQEYLDAMAAWSAAGDVAHDALVEWRKAMKKERRRNETN